MRERLIFLLMFGVLFPNCSNDAEDVSAVDSETSLTIKNRLTDTIYYFAADQNVLGTLDWIQTLDSDIAILPKSHEQISHDKVIGYQDSSTSPIVLYWWQAEVRDGVRIPGQFEKIFVKKAR